MDSQDTLHMLQVVEDKEWDDLEDNEQMVLFFALRHYLTDLTNNGGKVKRIVKVANMIDKLLPDVRDYAMTTLQRSEKRVAELKDSE